MNELEQNLERIGLSQYLESFIEEGFDTWETVLYITESDLDALNVRLGHRRRLQREIAIARNISFESLIPQIGSVSSSDALHNVEGGVRQAGGPSTESRPPVAGPATKRKYRRHPKSDENAPERPPSAYVIFSNATREEVKDQKLSFTEIAKAVGERWQNLALDEKKVYETKAAAAKEEYNVKLARYKRTNEFREYQQYLTDFKARNSATSADNKRPKMEKAASSGSTGSLSSGPTSATSGANPSVGQGRHRTDSLSGYRHSPSESAHGSPTLGLPRQASQQSIEIPSPSSAVASPTSTQSSRQGVGGQSTSTQPGRIQSLPRIIPLEPSREGAIPPTNLPPLMTDSPRGPYRRSANTTHASLLRHDTSKSSMSSNISSNTSTSSTSFTPITPMEESRTLGYPQAQPDTSAFANHSRPHSWALQHHQEPWPSSQTFGPSPFNRLSLADQLNAEGSAQSHLRSEHRARLEGANQDLPHPSSATQSPANPEESDAPRSGIDALSVLALAGHYVDRAEETKTPT